MGKATSFAPIFGTIFLPNHLVLVTLLQSVFQLQGSLLFPLINFNVQFESTTIIWPDVSL